MGWYNASWGYKSRIKINGSSISASGNYNLALDETRIPAAFFAAAKADGTDIIVTLGDSTTKIGRKLVSFDQVGETLEIHTAQVALVAGQDAYIELYCGNAAHTEVDANGLDSNFKFFNHCAESSGNLIDLTSNGFDATPEGGGHTYGVTGGFGKGVRLDGIASRFTLGNPAALGFVCGTNQFTIDICYKTNGALPNPAFLISKMNNSAPDYLANYNVYLSTSATRQHICQMGDGSSVERGAYQDDTLTIMSLVVRTTGFDLWVNGIKTTNNAALDGNENATDRDVLLGARRDASNSDAARFFGGDFFEVRISDVARPEGYVRLLHAMLTDQATVFELDSSGPYSIPAEMAAASEITATVAYDDGEFHKLVNNYTTTLAAELAQGATTMTVAATHAGLSAGSFYLTVWDKTTHPNPPDDPNMEIVEVTAVSGSDYTVTRGLFDTSDVLHANGSAVEMLDVAALITELQNAVQTRMKSNASNMSALSAAPDATLTVKKLVSGEVIQNKMRCHKGIKQQILHGYDTAGKTQYKVQTHAHSTESDGAETPAQLAAAYDATDTDVFTISDHSHQVTDPTPDPGGHGMLFILGIEENTEITGLSTQHIIAFGITTDTELNDAQPIIDAILADGGWCHIAHPTSQYSYGFSIEEMKQVYGVFGVEVFNGKVLVDEGASYAYSESWINQALSLGIRVYVVASDDCHDVTDPNQFNSGWIKVFADSLTQTEILKNMKRGNFYASRGAEISDIQVNDDTITLTLPAASTVTWYGKNGATLQTDSGVTTATYTLDGTEEVYVWPKVVRDSDSKEAWAQPFYLGTPPALFGLSGRYEFDTGGVAGKVSAMTFTNGQLTTVELQT